MEADSGEPMPFTNLSFLNPLDSSLVGGVTSDLEGRFEIVLPAGDYLLRISFIGYANFYQEVECMEGKMTKLRKLELSVGSQNLDEFEVKALRATFTSDIDKRVFNVENSILAEGGTAIDVLETLPSIQIDEEGGIRMRGSGQVLIYINGRPTNLEADDAESILAQFPANVVKNIELITNPSSRYDAAGSGGIINIVLKKDTRRGFNGRANGSVGTRNKYNSGVNLNYGSVKTNYFLNYDFRYEERFSENTTLREAFLPGSSRFLDQDFFSLRTNCGHVLRTGMDHSFSEKSNLSIYGQANVSNNIRHNDFSQQLSNAEGGLDSLISRNVFIERFQVNLETGLNYTLDIDTTGTKLAFSSSFAYDDREHIEYFNQSIAYGILDIPPRVERQNFGRPRSNQLFQAQVDFEKPLSKNHKIELGSKSTLEWDDRIQVFDVFDFLDNSFIRDDVVSNEVDFNRNVHAVYGIYRGKIGRLGYQAGLRMEHTTEELLAADMEEAVENNYLDLFPSVYVSYDLTERSDLLVNYSRRINRPSLWALAPLLNVRDPLNQRIGNPMVRPEYTDSYELGMAQSWSNWFLTGTLFHRRTEGALTRVFVDGGDNNALLTWVNLNRELATGFELINQFEVGNWMDATLTGNFFYNEVQGGAANPDFNNSNFSWTISLLANMKLGDWATAQINGNYRGPMVRPQGIIKPIYGINIGLRKEILNGKGTLAFNVTDVFNTRRFIIDIEDPAFAQQRTWDWETQIATISFTYRFGGYRDKPQRGNGRGNGSLNEGEF